MTNEPNQNTRRVVLERLQQHLPGKNLYKLALSHGITVYKNGHLNKGWAGQTLERIAGLSGSNLQERDGVDFELKSTSLIPDGLAWRPKETIRVTQLTPKAILEEEFEESALWHKLSSLILVGCYHASPELCQVVQVCPFELKDEKIVREIRGFWEDIRYLLSEGSMPDFTYHGDSSLYIQLRPTGTGKHSSLCPVTGRKFPSQAFYATKRLLEHVLENSLHP